MLLLLKKHRNNDVSVGVCVFIKLSWNIKELSSCAFVFTDLIV